MGCNSSSRQAVHPESSNEAHVARSSTTPVEANEANESNESDESNENNETAEEVVNFTVPPTTGESRCRANLRPPFAAEDLRPGDVIKARWMENSVPYNARIRRITSDDPPRIDVQWLYSSGRDWAWETDPIPLHWVEELCTPVEGAFAESATAAGGASSAASSQEARDTRDPDEPNPDETNEDVAACSPPITVSFVSGDTLVLDTLPAKPTAGKLLEHLVAQRPPERGTFYQLLDGDRQISGADLIQDDASLTAVITDNRLHLRAPFCPGDLFVGDLIKAKWMEGDNHGYDARIRGFTDDSPPRIDVQWRYSTGRDWDWETPPIPFAWVLSLTHAPTGDFSPGDLGPGDIIKAKWMENSATYQARIKSITDEVPPTIDVQWQYMSGMDWDWATPPIPFHWVVELVTKAPPE